MGWPSGIRALTSMAAKNCRCACFLPRMSLSTQSGSLIPDFFSVFQQSARDDRGHRSRVGSSFARWPEPKEAREGRARVWRLYRNEPELHPKLWGPLPAWRDDFHGLRGVDGQSSGEQADGEEAADAV